MSKLPYSPVLVGHIEFNGQSDLPMNEVHLLREIRELKEKLIRAKKAIHDCVERPKGVVPDSALEFYDEVKESK
jgi:hypothetical protein